jgi:hypothetical protein
MRIPLLLLTLATAARVAAQSPAPDFGPNVTIFDPATPAAKIQSTLDSIFASQETNQFGPARYALFFKPGKYHVDARIGFYTQVSGLGLSPNDVVINGGIRANARWRKGNATLNFWRDVENMSIVPAGGFDRWAVSQAAPMRRMHIRGDLVLDDGGWSSGGFLADSKVDGQVRSGSQQQWLTRNSVIGGWKGSNWNMVFVGTKHAPANSPVHDDRCRTFDPRETVPIRRPARRVEGLRTRTPFERGRHDLGLRKPARCGSPFERIRYHQAGHLRRDDEQRARA